MATRSSSGCPIVKKFNSYQEVPEFIKRFEVETGSKFISQKSRNLGQHDLQSLAKHKVWWHDPDDAKVRPKIACEDIPYVVLGTENRQCAIRINSGKPKSKTADCLARIRIRNVLRFPQFKIHGPKTATKQRTQSERLRRTFNSKTKREFCAYVYVPDFSEHQCHLQAKLSLHNNPNFGTITVDDNVYLDGQENPENPEKNPENPDAVSMEYCDGVADGKQSTVQVDSSDSSAQEPALSSFVPKTSITTPDLVASVVSSSTTPVASVFSATVSTIASAVEIDKENSTCKDSSTAVVDPTPTSDRAETEDSYSEKTNSIEESFFDEMVIASSKDDSFEKMSETEKTAVNPVRNLRSSGKTDEEENINIPSDFVETMHKQKTVDASHRNESSVLTMGVVKVVDDTSQAEMLRKVNLCQRSENTVVTSDSLKLANVPSMTTRSHAKSGYRKTEIVTSRSTRSQDKFGKTPGVISRATKTCGSSGNVNTEIVASSSTRARAKLGIWKTSGMKSYNTRNCGKLGILKTSGVNSNSTRTRGKLGLNKTAGVTSNSTRTCGKLGMVKSAKVNSGSTRTQSKLSLKKSTSVNSGRTRTCRNLVALKSTVLTSSNTRTGKSNIFKTVVPWRTVTRSKAKSGIGNTTSAALRNVSSDHDFGDVKTSKAADVPSRTSGIIIKSNIPRTSDASIKSNIDKTVPTYVQEPDFTSSETDLCIVSAATEETTVVPSRISNAKCANSDIVKMAEVPSGERNSVKKSGNSNQSSGSVESKSSATGTIGTATDGKGTTFEIPCFEKLQGSQGSRSKKVLKFKNAKEAETFIKMCKEKGSVMVKRKIDTSVGSPDSAPAAKVKITLPKDPVALTNVTDKVVKNVSMTKLTPGTILHSSLRKSKHTSHVISDSHTPSAATSRCRSETSNSKLTGSATFSAKVSGSPTSSGQNRVSLMSRSKLSLMTSNANKCSSVTISGSVTSKTSTAGSLMSLATIAGSVTPETNSDGSLMSLATIAGTVTPETNSDGSLMSLATIAGSVTPETNSDGSLMSLATIAGSVTPETNSDGSLMSLATIAGTVTPETNSDGSMKYLFPSSLTSKVNSPARFPGSVISNKNISRPRVTTANTEGSLVSTVRTSSTLTLRDGIFGAVTSGGSTVTSNIDNSSTTMCAVSVPQLVTSVGMVSGTETSSSGGLLTRNAALLLTSSAAGLLTSSAGGTLTSSTNGLLTSSAGGLLTSSAGDTLTSSAGGLLTSSAGGLLTSSAGGLLTSSAGGLLTSSAGGLLTSSAGDTVTSSTGGTLTSSAGGTLTSSAGGLLTSSLVSPLMSYLNVPGTATSIPNIPFLIPPTVPVNSFNSLASNLNVSGFGSLANVPGMMPGYLPPNVLIPLVLPGSLLPAVSTSGLLAPSLGILGAVTSGGSTITSNINNSLTAKGVVSVPGSTVASSAGGTVTLSANSTLTSSAGGMVTSSAGGIVTSSAGSKVTLSAGGTVTLVANSTLTSSAGGMVTSSAGGIVTSSAVGKVTSSAGGTVTSSAGSIVTSSASGTVISSAAGTVTSSAGGTVTSSAGGTVTSSVGGTVTSSAGGSVTISTGGIVTSSAGGAVTSNACGLLTSSAGGLLPSSAGDLLVSSAGGTVTSSASGTMTSSAGGIVTSSANSTLTSSAGGLLTSSAGDLLVASAGGTVTSSASGTLTSSAGGLSTSSAGELLVASAGGTVTSSASGTLTSSAGGMVTSSAGGMVTSSAGGIVPSSAGGIVTSSASGTVTSSAGGTVTSSAGGKVTSSAGGKVTSSAGGMVTSSAGGIVPSSAGGIVTSSASGTVTSSAGGTVTSSAGGKVTSSAGGKVTSSASGTVTSSAGGTVTSSASGTVTSSAGGTLTSSASGTVTSSANGMVTSSTGGIVTSSLASPLMSYLSAPGTATSIPNIPLLVTPTAPFNTLSSLTSNVISGYLPPNASIPFVLPSNVNAPNMNIPSLFISNNMNMQNLVKSNLNIVNSSSATASVTGSTKLGTNTPASATFTSNTSASVTSSAKDAKSLTSTGKDKDSEKSTTDINDVAKSTAPEKSHDKGSGDMSNTETSADTAQSTTDDVGDTADSASEYPENVVMSTDSKPLYKFKTLEEAYDFIDEYEVETMTRFAALKSRKITLKDVDSLDHYNIWYYNDSGCLKIPNDGTPFVILGSQDFECQLGRCRYKRPLKPDCRRRKVHSKKQGCPAAIHLRNVLRFPEFKMEGKWTSHKKRKHTACLSKTFSKDTVRERCIYVSVPDLSEHKHLEGIIPRQRLDERIVKKIHELTGQGVTKPMLMKPYLDYFVQTELQPKYNITFLPENKRFNPSLKDIRNHIGRALFLSRKNASNNSTDEGAGSEVSLIPLRCKCLNLVKTIATSIHKITDLKTLQALHAGLQETAKFATTCAKKEEETIEQDSNVGPTKSKRRKLMTKPSFGYQKAPEKSAAVNSPTKNLLMKSPVRLPFDMKYVPKYLSPVKLEPDNVQVDGTYDMAADTVYLDSSLLTGVNFNDSTELREAIENILGHIETSEQSLVENT